MTHFTIHTNLNNKQTLYAMNNHSDSSPDNRPYNSDDWITSPLANLKKLEQHARETMNGSSLIITGGVRNPELKAIFKAILVGLHFVQMCIEL
jgi:hypothetical protein